MGAEIARQLDGDGALSEHFFELIDRCRSMLKSAEVLTAWFEGEATDYIRFNQAKVRQPGSVTQRDVSLELIEGGRHVTGTVALTGDGDTDRERLVALIRRLRDKLPHVPPDPYLLYNTEPHSTQNLAKSELPDSALMLEDVLSVSAGSDMVGLLAAGAVDRGFANSLGQRNWFTRHSFNFDFSLYLEADKAIKANYAGFVWDRAELNRVLSRAKEQLVTFERPVKELKPGRYPVYLSPSALKELMDLLAWGGFGLKSQRTKQTPLLRMLSEDVALHSSVGIAEQSGAGAGPNFQSGGYVKPDSVQLVQSGRLVGALVSPRSAKEYAVQTNGASDSETPAALFMAPGDLPMADAAGELGEGLYVNNLWYLNYSDRAACRVTGMTRFGTFWVEGGKLSAPTNVMRFDETLYRMLGENLVSLTRECEFALAADTYGGRSTSCSQLPGALVQDFSLTL